MEDPCATQLPEKKRGDIVEESEWRGSAALYISIWVGSLSPEQFTPNLTCFPPRGLQLRFLALMMKIFIRSEVGS